MVALRPRVLRGLVSCLLITLAVLPLAGCSDDDSGGDSASDDTSAGADIGTEGDVGEDDTGSTTDVMGGDADAASDAAPSGPAPPNPDDYPADPLALPALGADADRPAAVYLPTDYAPDRWYPLVFMLHGYSANGMLQDFVFRLVERVTEYDMVLVVPEGTENSGGQQFWNATERCCNFEGSPVDDSAYLRGLVEEAMERFPVDTSRVVFWGHSNGGFMSYRMACDHSDVVTHVMSLAGVEFRDETRCEADTPVTVLQVHGTADETIPYQTSPADTGAQLTAERWAERNGCDPLPSQGQPLDIDTIDGDGTETDVFVWDLCEANTEVQLWTIEGGAHVPGFQDDFSDRALEFLMAHPRDL